MKPACPHRKRGRPGGRRCIAELMAQLRRIDKVVALPHLPDAAGLIKGMPFKGGARRGQRAGHHGDRLAADRAHIRSQPHHARAGAPGCLPRAEPGIQPGAFPFGQHAGVKLEFIPRTRPQRRAVRVGHGTVVAVPARRGITDRHRNRGCLVQRIIQVVAAIRPAGHIGCEQFLASVCVARVVPAAVQHAFIPPVGKIFDRSAPPHIIVEAIRVAVKPVMAAIDIDPPFKDMGFAVGHIFPQRQVRVPGWMFHNTHSFSGFGPPVVR